LGLPLAAGFREPPDETRPWCHRYRISDNVPTSGITGDLEAMRRAGIGAALIGHIYLRDATAGTVRVFSDG